METTRDTARTELIYIQRDPKHEVEKPYGIRYDVGGVIPRSNITHESEAVSVRNFRQFQNALNFSEYGFSVERMRVQMTDAVFNERSSIEAVYYPILENLLLERFPAATKVKVFEYSLRSRAAQFPDLDPKDKLEFSQPATIAHIDYTLESSITNACGVFDTGREALERVVTVNFWKTLQPGNDWPLALCDARSIDHSSDPLAIDIVYNDRYTENEFFYYNPSQRWYYVKDLVDDEIIMFLQKDSNNIGGGGVAHASFHNPLAAADAPARMSIEFRAYVIFE